MHVNVIGLFLMRKMNSKQVNKKHEEYTGIGVGTGIYCTILEFEAVLEIINEVRKTSMIQVKGNAGVGTIFTKLPRTQQDVYLLVAKLAEKHRLPSGFYAINKNREFIACKAREDDFHDIYSI